jgi:predicted phage terminase large subunit-like protein
MAKRKQQQSLVEQFRAEADRYGARSPEAKERRERAFDDFAFFCRTYLPHYFTLPLAPFQLQIADGLMSDQFLAVAAPREFGKSVLTGIGLPLWGMVTGRLRFQVDVGPSLDHARNNIMAIREELESNEKLISDFGPQKPEYTESKSVTWTQTMLVTRDRCAIIGRGAGSSLRGIRYREFRPDLVRLDDIEDDESVRNPDQRDKLWNWFKRVVMFLGRQSRIFVIGTVLHYDSLLARLLDARIKKFRALKFKGLTDDGTSLWPELVTTERLMEMKEADPVSFASEIQNEPIDEASAMFRREWLRFYKDEDLPDEWASVIEFVDPSLGGSARADYSAIVKIGRHKTSGRLYVFPPFIERVSPERLMDKIFERYQYGDPKPNVIGFESVGFQRVIKRWIDERARRAGVYVPIREVDQKGINKEARISRLSPLVENGTVLFPEKGAERLIEQMITFPKGDHDDGPDALEGAVSLLNSLGTATGFRAAKSLFQKVVNF